MLYPFCRFVDDPVVPLAGDVDRNYLLSGLVYCGACVVPLAGDVDRNFDKQAPAGNQESVVPLAGDVDRNVIEPREAEAVRSRPPRGGRG